MCLHTETLFHSSSLPFAFYQMQFRFSTATLYALNLHDMSRTRYFQLNYSSQQQQKKLDNFALSPSSSLKVSNVLFN